MNGWPVFDIIIGAIDILVGVVILTKAERRFLIIAAVAAVVCGAFSLIVGLVALR